MKKTKKLLSLLLCLSLLLGGVGAWADDPQGNAGEGGAPTGQAEAAPDAGPSAPAAPSTDDAKPQANAPANPAPEGNANASAANDAPEGNANTPASNSAPEGNAANPANDSAKSQAAPEGSASAPAAGTVVGDITVEATMNPETDKVDITVTKEGDVDGSAQYGVSVKGVEPSESYPPVQVSIDGVDDANLKDSIKDAYNGAGGNTDDDGNHNLSSVTINTGSVTETVENKGRATGIYVDSEENPVDITVAVEGAVTTEARHTERSENDANLSALGVEAINQQGAGTIRAGDVSATAVNATEEINPFGSANAYGVATFSSGTGVTDVEVANVTATANGVADKGWTGAYGVSSSTGGAGEKDEDGNPVFAINIQAKDVKATATRTGGDSANGYLYSDASAYGIWMNHVDGNNYGTGNAKAVVESVSATAVASGYRSFAKAEAIDALSNGGVTVVAVTGDATATAGDAEKKVFAEETNAYVVTD